MDYKPKRRRRWSRALVGHGADPRMALATALEIAAKDIQVREGAGSEPPVTASTVPSPRPSDPNPNAEAAECSNGGPVRCIPNGPTKSSGGPPTANRPRARACHLFRSPHGRAFCPGSDRGVLLCPGRLCGVEFPVALFDAASPFVSGEDDADVVWASAFASSGDFLLRFAGCQSKDLIPQGRRAALASRFPGCSALALASSRWSGRSSFRGRHFG